MAKVKLTEEEANEKYQEGYNDGRYTDGKNIIDDIYEMMEAVGGALVDKYLSIATLGGWDFHSDEEKEERLQEIYDAGYEQGQKDAEEYDEE